MQIQLQQVAPVFIEEEKMAGSQVWRSSLTFQKGEKIQIIAPSGSGKTSFIHFLYGLRKDYSGSILFNDKNINGFGPEDLAAYRRRAVSIVFQDLRLFPEQSVFQNLEIKRLLDPFHQESRITDMAKRLGIASKLQRSAGTCSFGEKQRIAIIRALQQPFDFLLLDEPFSHLDDNNRKLAMDLMEEEADLRKAAIILADLKPVEYFGSERSLNL